ncbi:MAG TPA: hypothetical protein VN948_01860 [Terriglobales bacterium]|nr:hypothetical protein [Terriglobales bacterium]
MKLHLTSSSLLAVSSMPQPRCAAIMHQKKSAMLRSGPSVTVELH